MLQSGARRTDETEAPQPEQVARKFAEGDKPLNQGEELAEVCRRLQGELGIVPSTELEATYYSHQHLALVAATQTGGQ